jgi:hypothetical protein
MAEIVEFCTTLHCVAAVVLLEDADGHFLFCRLHSVQEFWKKKIFVELIFNLERLPSLQEVLNLLAPIWKGNKCS